MRNRDQQEAELLNKLFKPPKLISRVEEFLKTLDIPDIYVGHHEGMILRHLCSQEGIKKVVEIGTQSGCSASWMASGLGSSGQLYCFEKDPYCAEKAREVFQFREFQQTGCQVEFLVGDALENLPAIEDQGPFDLIFIDANKSGYLSYWQWASENVGEKGYIVADNVYLSGTMFLDECPEKRIKTMWSNMKKFLQRVFSDSRFDSYIIPTQEGLSVSQRKSSPMT